MKKVYRLESNGKCYHVGMGNQTRTGALKQALNGEFPGSNHTKSFMFFLLAKQKDFKIIETEEIYTKEQAEELETEWKSIYGFETCGTIGQELVDDLIKNKNISQFTEFILRSWGKNGDAFCKGRTHLDSMPKEIKNELIDLLGDIF